MGREAEQGGHGAGVGALGIAGRAVRIGEWIYLEARPRRTVGAPHQMPGDGTDRERATHPTPRRCPGPA